MTTQQCKKCDSTVNTFEKNHMTNKYFNLCNLCRTKCCQTCEKIFPLSEYDSDKRTNERYNDCRECREKQKQERKHKYYEEHRDKINQRKRGSETKKAYNKQYQEVHKEQIMEARNVKFDCGCGGVYSIQHKTRHETTKKHVAWVTNQTTPTEI